MFKHFYLLALILGALTLSGVAPSYAKDSTAQAANRRALVDIYARLDQAARKKDLAIVLSYIAPETRFYSNDGSSLDREQYARIQSVTWAPPGLKIPESKTTVTKFQWRGPDAIIWTRSVTRMTGPGGTLMIYASGRDYWGKIAGKWQVRQAVTLSKRLVLNGKVIYDS